MIDQTNSIQSTERTTLLLRELYSMILQRSAGEMMKVMCAASLSMPQMVALHLLRNWGSFTISALADKLSLSLAATSHLVDRMVQQQLVERKEDALDRRQKQVAIAPGGLALLDRLLEARMRESGHLFTELPPDLREQLEVVLAQVVAEGRQLGQEISSGIKNAFTDSVIQIYWYAIPLVLLAFVITLFMPELPLRRSNGPAPVVAIE